MKYLSLFSGIEAASVAWHHLNWKPVAFAEIEKFPSAVLAHRYPNVSNWGDVTKFKEWPDANFDVLVGGSPCQSFSVAGLRKGLDDPRGNLTLTYLAIAQRYLPRWVVWENVPGVLSDQTGAFGAFLGGLAELGYGYAWRILDAQYFGVPQRRRRVFVIGHLGDWRAAAAVLFDSQSMCGYPPPSRKKGTSIADPITAGSGKRSNGRRQEDDWNLVPDVSRSLANVGGGNDPGANKGVDLIPEVAWAIQERDHKGADSDTKDGHLIPEVYRKSARAQSAEDGETWVDDGVANTLNQFDQGDVRTTHAVVEVYENHGQDSRVKRVDVAPQLNAKAGTGGNNLPFVRQSMRVRRLTPKECERLQDFDDDYTKIPYRGKPAEKCPDGPRYKGLGNSMAVPVMKWIGERIELFESLAILR